MAFEWTTITLPDNPAVPISSGEMNALGAAVELLGRITIFDGVGDGTTDDRAAIQAAITALGNAGGGVLYIPKPSASYSVGSTVTVPDNVTLRAEAYGGVTFRRSASFTSGNVLDLTGGSNIAIEDIFVDGNGDATNSCIYASNTSLETDIRFRRVKTNDGQYGLYLYYAQGVTVEDCILDGAGNGMYLNSVIDCLVDGNLIKNTLTGTLDGMGIKIDGSSRGVTRGVRIVNNHIENCDDNGIGMRAMASSLHDVVIANNTVVDSGKCGIKVGVESADYDTNYLRNIVIVDNVVRGWGNTEGGIGIAIYDYNTDAAAVGVEGAAIVGNTVDSTHTSGSAVMNQYILASFWHGGVISGNSCYGAGVRQEGILLDDCVATSVNGNTVTNAAQNATANTKGGIQCSNSEYVAVNGNVIRNTGSSAGNQAGVYLYYTTYDLISSNFIVDDRATKYMSYGVREAGGTGCDYNFVDGNFIVGAVTSPVSLSGSNSTNSDNKAA